MAFKDYIKEMDESKFVALSDCIFDLLFFAEQIHVWHLQTGSYAQHMAFNDLYDGIPGIVDDIAEAMTGMNRKLVAPTKTFAFTNLMNVGDAINKIDEFKNRAEVMLKATNDYAGVNNSLTDLVSLFDKTIYKLKNLG